MGGTRRSVSKEALEAQSRGFRLWGHREREGGGKEMKTLGGGETGCSGDEPERKDVLREIMQRMYLPG